jgi:predicted DNA-binding transcriptional regulator AlpA
MVDVAESAAPNPTQFNESDIMLPPEVARMLHCHPLTLLRWHNMRTGPPRIKIGRKVYYHRRDVEEYLHSESRKDRRRKERP